MKKTITTILGTMMFVTAFAVTDTKTSADTNADGTITTADAQLIYDYILGTADDSLTIEQVDINGDGKVDTADVVEVYLEMKKGLKGSAPDSDDTEFGY